MTSQDRRKKCIRARACERLILSFFHSFFLALFCVNIEGSRKRERMNEAPQALSVLPPSVWAWSWTLRVDWKSVSLMKQIQEIQEQIKQPIKQSLVAFIIYLLTSRGTCLQRRAGGKKSEAWGVKWKEVSALSRVAVYWGWIVSNLSKKGEGPCKVRGWTF